MNVFLDGRFAVLHGELGWELHGPDGNMLAVYDALWAAGEAHGIANYGSFAMNAMRMEKGFKGAGDLEAALADEKITIIADVVGGAIWPALINVLTRGGRYTCSGAIAGPMVNFDLRTFYLHDLTFTDSTVIDQEVMPRLIGYIEAGKVKPVLAATYALTELHAGENVTLDVSRACQPATAIRMLKSVASHHWVEQPCETLDQCAIVSAREPQPIMLDECMHTLQDHLDAWRLSACRAVKVKPSRLGAPLAINE